MNASRVALASALLALLVLPVAAYAASNIASNSLVKFYSDKANYLPNSKIKLTVEFAEPFTGTVLIQIKDPSGKVVDMSTVSLSNATVYTYVFQHNEAKYGYGTFQATLTYSGYVVANGQQSTVFSTTPLVISFTIAPTYSIKGRVVDQNGNPVAGATVVIKETGAGTTTDANGTFVLPVPGPGKYTICAKKVDYLENTTTVDIAQVGVTTLKEPLVLTSQVYAIMKLMDQMKVVNTTLKSLVTNVAALSDKYSALSNSLQEIAAAVQKLEQSSSQQAQQIEALQKQLSSLADQIKDLQSSVEETMKSIDDLKNALSSYATKDYVDSQVADLKNVLQELSASLQQLQSQVQQLQQQLSTLQSQAATKDEAKQYAQQAASQVKQEIMSELEAKISDVNKKIAGLEDKVSKLQGQVNNLQQSLLQQLTSQLNKVTEQLNKVTNNANSASRWALVAVAIAIIGIILAIFVAIKVMKLTAA